MPAQRLAEMIAGAHMAPKQAQGDAAVARRPRRRRVDTKKQRSAVKAARGKVRLD